VRHGGCERRAYPGWPNLTAAHVLTISRVAVCERVPLCARRQSTARGRDRGHSTMGRASSVMGAVPRRRPLVARPSAVRKCVQNDEFGHGISFWFEWATPHGDGPAPPGHREETLT
jgi:hypothetical protein